MATFPTVNVTINLVDASGLPLPEVLCLFRCNRASTAQDVILPTNIRTKTDSNGSAVVQLCPNSFFGGAYGVRLTANGYDVRGIAVVPDRDCLLDEIFQPAPYPEKTYVETAVAEIVATKDIGLIASAAATAATGAADTAMAAAATSTTKAAEAAASASAAETAKTGAEMFRDEAAGYAAGLNMPAIAASNAGQIPAVNADGTGYELKNPAEIAGSGTWSSPIAATYLSPASFSSPTDRTGEFSDGVRVKADCGADGLQYGTVESSAYADPTTTVALTMDDGNTLTSNLVSVAHGNDDRKSLVSHAEQHMPGGRDPLPIAGENPIINGNFDIWQRGTTASATGYLADRFYEQIVGDTVAVSRQAFGAGDTEAFDAAAQYYHRASVTLVSGASNVSCTRHRIEGVRSYAGREITLSFQSRETTSGLPIAVEVVQHFGTGGSPSADVTGIGSQQVAQATDFSKKTITVDVPSIAGKTIGTNSDDWLEIIWWYSAGSDYDSRTATLGQQSGTFDLAQIKIDTGSTSTPFIRMCLAYELLRCQRYYESSVSGPPGTISGPTGGAFFLAVDSTSAIGGNSFRTIKRVVPAMKVWNPATGTIGTARNNTSGADVPATISDMTAYGITRFIGSITPGAQFSLHWSADSEFY